MRVENMIDGMSDACYLEQYCFRHHLHSRNLAARFLRIAMGTSDGAATAADAA